MVRKNGVITWPGEKYSTYKDLTDYTIEDEVTLDTDTFMETLDILNKSKIDMINNNLIDNSTIVDNS